LKKRLFLSVFLIFYCFSGCSSSDRVSFVEKENQIDVLIDNEPVASYRYGSELTKPILYPVFTPSGIKLTRGFPFEKVEGEATDHPHHTGMFFTYDDVNGSGFWNNTIFPPQIKQIKFEEETSGDKGVLKTESLWIGKNNDPLLRERRTMTFIPGSRETIIDFDITLTALVDTVLFNDTKEGMFAIRVAQWLREEDQTGQYLSSNGDIGEKNIWGKRAEWVRLEGQKDGKKAGIAIMNHPGSVNYPTFWHARAYGLFSANPLGQYVFETARGAGNPKKFALTLSKGESAKFLFRMIVYDGSRSSPELEKRFKEYAE
jgi:hypothetical protein